MSREIVDSTWKQAERGGEINRERKKDIQIDRKRDKTTDRNKK